MSDRYRQDPDVLLMLRVRDGDDSAFEILVRAYTPILVNFMYRFEGTGGAAEDLAQEVFMRIYAAAANYEPTARFRTWLMTVATNLCLNRRRWASRHPIRSLDAAGESGLGHPVDPAATPRETCERDELRAAVRNAILALPENQRLAVILARYHELPYAEIARAMSLSAMAVKSLLNRARENLREALRSELQGHVVSRAEGPLPGPTGGRS